MALRTALVLLVAGVASLGGLNVTGPTHAVSNLTLSGAGTAEIDGILDASEWSNSGSYDFPVNLPTADGGGTTRGTVFVMNDATDLYIAVRVVRSQFRADSVFIHFDSDRDGYFNGEGEDYIGVSPTPAPPPHRLFNDGVYTSAPPCPSGSRCGFLDVQVGGTTDGEGAAANDGVAQVYEMRHPLDSDDDDHDFSLTVGDTVRFYVDLRNWSLILSCNEGPACYADTDVSGPDYLGIDILVVAGPMPPAPTHIAELEPGINLVAGPLMQALAPEEYMACIPPDAWTSIYLWDAKAQRWLHSSNAAMYPAFLNRPEVGGIQTLPKLSPVTILTTRAVPDARLKDGPGRC